MANNQQNSDQTNLPTNDDADPTKHALPLPNGGGGGGSNDSRACAACKYQRRRCAPDCPLAPYFPPTEPEKFANAHKVFGLRNIMRVYKEVPANQRDAAMESMIWEAGARALDPVGGCYRIVQRLESEIKFYKAEWEIVRTQLEYFQNLFAAHAANAAAADVPGGSGAASGSNSKEPVNTASATYFPPPVSSQAFGGVYPDFQNGAAGLGFSDGNPIPNPTPIPPLESFLPPVSGYPDALAAISNKTLTSSATAATSSSDFPPPEPFCTAAAGGSEEAVAAGGYEQAAPAGGISMKTEEDGQTLISSGSDLSDSFFPVGGYQEALKQAMAFTSVDHDVGLLSNKRKNGDGKATTSSSANPAQPNLPAVLPEYDVGPLSKKMKNGDGKAIPSSSAHPPQPNLPGYEEDHDDVSFIPKNIKQESPSKNGGEKNDEKPLKSQLHDGRGEEF